MKPAVRVAAVLSIAAVTVSGCVYFNGMYNADRYARQAAASERAGRIGEARDRWQQAEVHAESVLARHPHSSWTAEAQLVRGRALVHLELYSDGALALQAAAQHATSPARHLEALGLLGHAYFAMGMLDSAGPALDSAVQSLRREVRDEALLDRGRLRIARGEPDSARSDLEQSRDPRAPYDLARVDLKLGDTAAAGALYDSLAAGPKYQEAEWRSGLDSLAAAGAGAHASQLVDRLTRRATLSNGAKARLMLDDAVRRLGTNDTAGAATEFQRVVRVARDSVAGQSAAVALCRLAIAEASSDSDLDVQREQLTSLVRSGGGAGREAREALRLVARLDTLAAAPSAPDAFWFLRAELLRDSLHAGRLAATAFARMTVLYPASPWTPKAVVAAIAGGHPAADSLRSLLAQRYAASPYAIAALGGGRGDDSSYSMLEDSLRRVLAVRQVPRAPAGVAPRAPGQVGEVDDEPGARRPAPPATRPTPRPAGPPQPEPPQ